MPLNINDSDLHLDMDHALQDRNEFTDLTFSLICHEILVTERQLNFVPPGATSETIDDPTSWWISRKDLAIACEGRLRTRLLRHCDHSIPIQRYSAIIGEIMIAHIWLIVYRPLQRHPAQPPSLYLPPHTILSLANRVIEHYQKIVIDPQFENFRWVTSIWSQWHALAVMIADLQVQVEGTVVERAWTLLEEVFEVTGSRTADSRQGRIWKFIEKMMAKARDVRKKHLESIKAYSALGTERNVRSDHNTKSTALRSGDDSMVARLQIQPAQEYLQVGTGGYSFAGSTGPLFAEQDFSDWSHPTMNESQHVDRGWAAEWEAFVEEYHNVVHFPI